MDLQRADDLKPPIDGLGVRNAPAATVPGSRLPDYGASRASECATSGPNEAGKTRVLQGCSHKRIVLHLTHY